MRIRIRWTVPCWLDYPCQSTPSANRSKFCARGGLSPVRLPDQSETGHHRLELQWAAGVTDNNRSRQASGSFSPKLTLILCRYPGAAVGPRSLTFFGLGSATQRYLPLALAGCTSTPGLKQTVEYFPHCCRSITLLVAAEASLS